jgi:branched-chain amino acid transport system ATP-binding protein
MALLEVKNVTKRFGGLVAVKDLSLAVDQGDIIGMIGPNGAGKTTAFNVIAGYYHPDEGQIIFDGEDISKTRTDIICKKGLARTFQLDKPFPELSVLDNIMVGAYNRTNNRKKAQSKALEALEFLEMKEIKSQLTKNLPVGFRKRLEIAKALSTEPRLILLDEVMAGLRPNEMDDTIKIVRKISESGVAIIIVEHVMKVIMALARRIIVLHHGEKIAEDNPKELIRNKVVIDAYLGEVSNYATSQSN